MNTGDREQHKRFQHRHLQWGTGVKIITVEGVAVGPKRWLQINNIPALRAPGMSQGYTQVKRTSGNNPFIAYAVINDSGQPGERSGDGAFVASSS